mmetsp:Transcript_6428/g.11762  ORF Transcript_6428/g.11762 Transcript_6428/m.11762 type:complete len:217 (-) Transcript_6428:7-657(-)
MASGGWLATPANRSQMMKRISSSSVPNWTRSSSSLSWSTRNFPDTSRIPKGWRACGWSTTIASTPSSSRMRSWHSWLTSSYPCGRRCAGARLETCRRRTWASVWQPSSWISRIGRPSVSSRRRSGASWWRRSVQRLQRQRRRGSLQNKRLAAKMWLPPSRERWRPLRLTVTSTLPWELDRGGTNTTVMHNWRRSCARRMTDVLHRRGWCQNKSTKR